MEELYRIIENKIKEAGYPKEVSGADIYTDLCDQMEDKENGSYLLLSKHEEDVIFEYLVTINDEDFNLSVLTIKSPEGQYVVNFDD